jgi:uncharacterized membrane protein
MEPRVVPAGHGWIWIAQGYALFRKSPAAWLALLLLLFASSKLLLGIPLLGLLFVLLMPIFIVGLMEGCRALERGGTLVPTHLLAGFHRNAAHLVTIGGVSLLGNLLLMMIVMTIGGESITALTKWMSQGTPPTPQAALEMQAAAREVMRALLIGTVVSLPLLMALWYAPLLVYFNDLGPLQAMKASFVACIRNVPAMFVYGLVIVAGMFLAMPFSMALRQYDLALWLLAPVVLPSIYASYKDIFPAAAAPQPGTDSVARQ